MDSTTDFLRTFYSQKFSSFEEFQCRMKDFEKLTNSVYIIKSSKRLPEHNLDRDRLVYSSLDYVCYHFSVYQNSQDGNKPQRNSCNARISLSAMHGKLWITKYHMIHNHSPLPECAKLNPNIRNLQVPEQGKDDSVISEEVQVVLDDIVEQFHSHNTTINNTDDETDVLNSSETTKPVCERKAAARDRLAQRTKKARGLKLAPCLRRLAELASAGTGKEFHKHLNELETLVGIWRRGDVSSLISESDDSTNINNSIDSDSPAFTKQNARLVPLSEPASVSPASNNSLAIARVVEQLFQKQKLIEKTPNSTPPRPRGRPPKISKVQNAPIGQSSVTMLPALSVALKQALGSPTTMLANQNNHCIVSSSLPQLISASSLETSQTPGQMQLINNSAIFQQKSTDVSTDQQSNQTIVGYVLQPIHGVASGVSSFLPIAPKGLVSEVSQGFQNLSSPKPIGPPMSIGKPKITKPRLKQLKSKSPLKDSMNVCDSHPILEPFEGEDNQRPWTSMIMEGDSCPYFLYIEDANFYYSAAEDAWLPVDNQPTAIEN